MDKVKDLLFWVVFIVAVAVVVFSFHVAVISTCKFEQPPVEFWKVESGEMYKSYTKQDENGQFVHVTEPATDNYYYTAIAGQDLEVQISCHHAASGDTIFRYKTLEDLPLSLDKFFVSLEMDGYICRSKHFKVIPGVITDKDLPVK